MCLSPFLPVGCTLQQLIRTSTKHAVVAAVVADNDEDGDEDEGYADEDDRDEEDGDEDGDEMVTRRL